MSYLHESTPLSRIVTTTNWSGSRRAHLQTLYGIWAFWYRRSE